MIERKLSGARPKTAMPPGATDTHMHAYLPNFPSQAGGPDLPLGVPGPDEYRQVMGWLGIERVVAVQGNAHQFDNDSLIACMKRLGPIARGVAVVTGETTDAEMQALHDAGVRGARIMDLPGGAVGMDGLEAVDARVQGFGWCLVVQFDGGRILDHVEKLERLESRYVIDHHGKFLSGPPQLDDLGALKRLIDRGNCWLKFAACYESSRSGGPDYEDIAAPARAFAEHAPERIIWASNWPHNQATRTEDYPDDAALLDTVLGWIPAKHHRKVLVESPAELFDF